MCNCVSWEEEMDFEQQWLKLPLEEDILQLGTPLPEKNHTMMKYI